MGIPLGKSLPPIAGLSLCVAPSTGLASRRNCGRTRLPDLTGGIIDNWPQISSVLDFQVRTKPSLWGIISLAGWGGGKMGNPALAPTPVVIELTANSSTRKSS